MLNKGIFRKQQLRFMISNLIAFAVIFTIFSIIIFSQVQSTLISKTDNELLSFKEKIMTTNYNGPQKLRPNADLDNFPAPDEKQKAAPNPRIIVLNLDKSGQIMNKGQIGSLFYENYLQDYELDTANLDKITMITVNDSYHFRSIVFQDTNDEDEIAYTQLMINVDAEQTIINNFGRLIMLCSIIFTVLSIIASFILSRKMIRPIIHSWNKQAEFVENASHELRTPLTIIQNKLELLLTAPQERIMDRFEHIALSLSETRRLSKLTSDLLTLARADSAEAQLVKQPIHVDTFVESVCSPYKEIAESQEKYVWMNLNCDIAIQADEVRLHQLLVILLDNALKYTSEHDSIGVKTYIEENKIVLEISDTGIGIKEENIKHIFDRFYREDKARSRETGGIGLGLSIAQWIVVQHHGTIKVFSNKNKGTTFKITLPK